MKLAGAVMVLLGGVAAFVNYSRTQRRQLRLVRDISAALTQLAGEIRWRNLSIPQAIDHLCDRKISGPYFGEIADLMKSNMTLQESWQSVFSHLPTEMAEILFALEWGGDAERQEKSILYAAGQMTELSRTSGESLRQREKLCAAAALSGAGLLIVILV